MCRTTMPEDCPICMAPAKEPLSTACGHTFCTGCLEEWSHEHNSCPLCRAPLVEDNKNILRILYKLIALFFSVVISSALAIDLEERLDMKFPMRKEAKCSLFASLAIFLFLVSYVAMYPKGFDGRVHAQRRQLTAERLLV